MAPTWPQMFSRWLPSHNPNHHAIKHRAIIKRVGGSGVSLSIRHLASASEHTRQNRIASDTIHGIRAYVQKLLKMKTLSHSGSKNSVHLSPGAQVQGWGTLASRSGPTVFPILSITCAPLSHSGSSIVSNVAHSRILARLRHQMCPTLAFWLDSRLPTARVPPCCACASLLRARLISRTQARWLYQICSSLARWFDAGLPSAHAPLCYVRASLLRTPPNCARASLPRARLLSPRFRKRFDVRFV
jgi:hypothetical protein